MTSTMLGRICLITISFFCAEYSVAQQDSSLLLDEVILTATRKSDLVKDLPYSTISLKRNDAEKQLSRTLPESLTGLAGIFIQKTNHGGGSPFVRGLTGNQTLLMVDGIRLNNSLFRFGPNQYLTLIDNLVVEKIEVVKGTGSVQYGSDALTGVINVITRSQEFTQKSTWKGRLTSRFTGFGMEKTARPEISYSNKKFAFMAGLSKKSFGDLRGGDTTGFQVPSGYGELAWDTKFKWNLGSNAVMTFSYQSLKQSDVPVYHKYILENYAINNADLLKRGFGYVNFKKTFTSNVFKSLTAFISEQDISELRNLRKNGSPSLRIEHDRALTISGGLDLLTDFFKGWSANSGVEIYADKITSSRVDQDINNGVEVSKRGLYPNGAKYQNFAIYTLHHFQLNRFRFEAGGRYNTYRIGIADTSLGGVLLKPSALVFQGGVGYAVSKHITVYGNISNGYRAPNVDDMGTLGIVDFRYEIPAYDLKPERSTNYEAGLKWVTKKTSGSIGIFNTSLSNLITRVKTPEILYGYSVYKKQNVEKGYIQGWEIQSMANITKRFYANMSVTSLYGQNITKNEPLRRIPPLNGQVGIHYQKNIIKAGGFCDFASAQHRLAQGDKDDNRIPQGGTPGFKIINLYSGIELNKVVIRLYLNNILNSDYRTHGSGINGMGRSVSATVILKIEELSHKSK
jgi:outer membrane receptor protein involved in Fe transport